uniref:Uncharacterized protein n=1 Tax=Oryza punctata TaxID=4537 RepID=A0A0E0KYY9_ORYPU
MAISLRGLCLLPTKFSSPHRSRSKVLGKINPSNQLHCIPVRLIEDSSLSLWSWKPNMEELNPYIIKLTKVFPSWPSALSVNLSFYKFAVKTQEDSGENTVNH